MLRNVIEDYLASIREVQFFVPFYQLLESLGYYDIHLIHGPAEFGKDFIAKKIENDTITQYSFQLKMGDVNLPKLRDIKGQLLESITNKLAHPNFDRNYPYKVVFVLSGNLLNQAKVDFQEFNEYVEKKLQEHKILVWEKDKLVNDFLKIGLEPFFALHKDQKFYGNFFSFYSRIFKKEFIDLFEIENHTKYWLDLDWNEKEDRLLIVTETYIFASLLHNNGRLYEAMQFLASLIRVLYKNESFDEYKEFVELFMLEILEENLNNLEKLKDEGGSFFDSVPGILTIFYYPLLCLRSLEILSLYFLLFGKNENRVKDLFIFFIETEKGVSYPISDNYGVSIYLISLAMLKLNLKKQIEKLLVNTTVWLCDRFESIGICAVGASLKEECEQLLSEHLSGLNLNNLKTSYCCNVILDVCFLVGQQELYEDIANEFKAVEVIPENYHVLQDESLFVHDHRNIRIFNDHDFSTDFKDDYTQMIRFERTENKITKRNSGLLYLTFLLRDRHFPTILPLVCLDHNAT